MQPLFLRAIKAQLVLLVTSMMFFTTGCEDDDHNHDEDHTDAEGFVLENESGTEVYKEFEGAIVTNNLTLSVGDTLELSVHFLDHDGDEIQHEEEEGEEDAEGEVAKGLADPFEKIRGYKAVDEGSLRVEVPGPGHWVLTGAGTLEKVGDKAEL